MVYMQIYGQEAKVSCLKAPNENYMIYGKTSDAQKKVVLIITDKVIDRNFVPFNSFPTLPYKTLVLESLYFHRSIEQVLVS